MNYHCERQLFESGASCLSFQKLLCTDSPLFDVEEILFSQTGTHIALIGTGGATVLELPQRWGKYAEFQGGKESILCRTIPVAERFFRTNGEKLLHAAWHPGSPVDLHLVLLTSDNGIRIYNLQNPQTPAHAFLLGESAQPDYSHTSKLNVQQVLGESAVSFAFGPPVPLVPLQRLKANASNCKEETHSAWPIYILLGNGNVYSILTALDLKFQLNTQLRGPLIMYPPAEDNYGTDACSLLCLGCRPPVLVVATCEGKLYHCVLLNKGDEDQVQVEVERENLQLYQPVPESMLYVYESVEIEFSLTTVAVETNELVMDDYSCPIKLHAESGCVDRYHCSHNSGVHTVALPWASKLQEFCDMESSLPTLGSSDQAIVEHLVCTKPSVSSSAAPIMGLDVTSDRLLGPTLLCLTQTCQCLPLPLVERYQTSTSTLLSMQPTHGMTSPLRKLRRECFDQYISNILQRNSSVPLLKQTGKSPSTPEECFQLLSRVTQVFREEYIQKQDLAREQIEKRTCVLRDQKVQQQSDLQHTQQAKNILTETARALAEKYESASEIQEQLVDRIETVLKKIQSRLAVVSNAEKSMHKELLVMEEQLQTSKARIQQLKVKQEYQSGRVERSTNSNSGSPAFSRTQTGHLRSLLKQESDNIGDLVQQVTHLKVSLDT